MAVYCPNCGKKLPDDAEFCNECGTRISLQKTENSYQDKNSGKKKTSVLMKIVKWFVILNVVCMLFLLLMSFLESVYHRTAQAKPEGNSVSAAGMHLPAVKDLHSAQTDDIPQGLSDIRNVWFDDFLFYEEDVYENGIPDGAVMREAGYISGEWKYCMTFGRTIPGEERIDEIGTAEVAFSEYGAQLILHPQYIRWGSEVQPENEAEAGYEPFSGTWDPEYIDLSDGRISIGLGPYYSFEGRDYVLGNIVVKDTGMFGDVLLVRP